MKRILTLTLILLQALPVLAQPDTTAWKSHKFTINSNIWTRGEYRKGAMPIDNGADYALFLMGSATLSFDYTWKGLEVRFAPRFAGVWGASTTGGLVIDEAWFGLQHRSGLFFRMGRQKLAYDDERIFGSEDWSMVSLKHDMVKAGLERGAHKIHLMFAFNQNDENINGGTYYINGGQPYKSMQSLWYHVDPIPQLGLSAVFINTGMQNELDKYKDQNITEYQQLFGAYADFHPKNFRLQASYYRQTGHEEHGLPIHAWMAAAELDWCISSQWGLNAGAFYMSGDENFFVPPLGDLGVALKKEVRGFNPIFGSHHKFYGAMDFFYVRTYYGGNTPGLQDYHIGAKWNPIRPLSFAANYHFLATAVKIQEASRALGHEVEVGIQWDLMENVSLQAGYSYMKGTDTMTILKRTSDKNSLHWAWFMFTVTPEIFSYRK